MKHMRGTLADRCLTAQIAETTPTPKRTPWYLDAAAIGAILALFIVLFAVFGDPA